MVAKCRDRSVNKQGKLPAKVCPLHNMHLGLKILTFLRENSICFVTTCFITVDCRILVSSIKKYELKFYEKVMVKNTSKGLLDGNNYCVSFDIFFVCLFTHDLLRFTLIDSA